jgi:hypothetical protein
MSAIVSALGIVIMSKVITSIVIVSFENSAWGMRAINTKAYFAVSYARKMFMKSITGANVIKPYFFVTYQWPNKLVCLFGKPLQINLLFASKARSLLKSALLANIMLGWKRLPGTNVGLIRPICNFTKKNVL